MLLFWMFLRLYLGPGSSPLQQTTAVGLTAASSLPPCLSDLPPHHPGSLVTSSQHKPNSAPPSPITSLMTMKTLSYLQTSSPPTTRTGAKFVWFWFVCQCCWPGASTFHLSSLCLWFFCRLFFNRLFSYLSLEMTIRKTIQNKKLVFFILLV